MKLSIIMPVKNGENYLHRSLASVESEAVEGTELIVINDGSTDTTEEIVMKFQQQSAVTVKYLKTTGEGVSAARNKGLDVAQGEYLIFLDHDDYFPEGRIKRHIDYLSTNGNIDFVVGKTGFIADDPAKLRIHDVRGDGARHTVNLGNMTYRHQRCFPSTVRFNEGQVFAEDLDLYLKLRDHGLNVDFLDEVSLFYNFHEANTTLGYKDHCCDMFKMLRDSISRKHKKGMNNESRSV